MIKNKISLLFLLMVMTCTFVLHNGVLPVNIMEARNLTTAREMAEDGNWFKPTMNGLPRLEKPPLPTWIAAATITVFGQESLSLLRFPSAIAAILLVIFLFLLAKEISSDPLIPFLTAGIASTSFYLFFLARDASWDIFCHSFMLGAIWLLHKGLKHRQLKIGLFIGSAFLMTLSFLSKGPVAFYALLLPYLIALWLTRKESSLTWHTIGLTVLIVLTVVLCAIWPVYVYETYANLSTSVAAKESTAWFSNNSRSFFHYWSFPAQSGIWVLPAAISLVYPYMKKRCTSPEVYLFAAFWTLSSVILLSLVPEKKERYLMPVLLPMSITTAFYFRYLVNIYHEKKEGLYENLFLKGYGYLTSFAAFLIPVVNVFLLLRNGKELFIPFIIISFLFFFSLGFFQIRAVQQKKPLSIWVGMVLIVAFTTGLMMRSVPEIIVLNKQFRPYSELRHRSDIKNLPFYTNVPRYDKSLEVIWESGKKIQYLKDSCKVCLPPDKSFVLLSADEPEKHYTPEVLADYQLIKIGLFDANMQERWEDGLLRNWVTVFHKRKE